MSDRELDRAGLDRWITGNWGQDQFSKYDQWADEDTADALKEWDEPEIGYWPEGMETMSDDETRYSDQDFEAYIVKVAEKGLMQALRETGVL